MKVRLSELDLADLGDEIWDEIAPRAVNALDKGVDRILDQARTNLSRRRGTRRTAAPGGEAPEYDEGDLSRSLRPGRMKRTKYSISRDYGSDHPSAGLHEFGGTVLQDGKRRTYPPRSYMRTAEETTAGEVERILLEDL